MIAGLWALVLIQTQHNGLCLPLLCVSTFWHCALLIFYSYPAFLDAHYITKRSLVKGSSGADARHNNRKHAPIVKRKHIGQISREDYMMIEEVQSHFFFLSLHPI